MAEDLRHPIFARLYPKVDASLANIGGSKHRAELLVGASGRLLEIGAGHGANFAFYPAEVTEAIAIEPEPRLRSLAREAAAATAIPIDVRPGRAEALDDLEDASVDVAVTSLVLCSIKDPRQALRQLHRVIRPGGELRFYEHVRGPTPAKVRVQRAADLLWPFFAGGCHVSRPTDRWIAETGFSIRTQRHFTFPDGAELNPASPHVIGIAERAG